MMNKITIMGMSHRVQSLKKDSYDKIIIRTKISKIEKILSDKGIDYISLDSIYESTDDFTQLDINLSDEVINQVKDCDVLYIVPGSAVTLDGSVSEILKRYSNVEILHGDAPEYDLLSNCRQVNASCGYSIIPASCLEKSMFSPRLPLIISALDNMYLMSDTKILLSDEYGDEHQVIVGGLGEYKKIPIFELDRYENCDHNTMIYVPIKSENARYDLHELENIFRKLRSPEGCPWDRQQNHVSLKRYLLEECAEVIDAIDSGDMHELCEELGDVLLQVLFHATLAEERGDFDMRDICDILARKLIKRHPHVFMNANANNPTEVKKLWDEIKFEDKDEKTVAAKLNEVPKSMPALMKAQKVLSRASKASFIDNDSQLNYEDKVDESISNIVKSIEKLKKSFNSNIEDSEFLIGEILFQIANTARLLDFEAELLLQDSIKRFIKHFTILENNSQNQS